MKLEALKELAAKVEVGSTSWSGACVKAAFDGHYQSLFYESFHGSLDAAKALHDAVLPGWVYGLNFDACDEKYAFVSDGDFETDEQYCETHARAWLLAILRALIAQEEGN